MRTPSVLALIALLPLAFAACTTVDEATFSRYQAEGRMELTQGDTPAGAEQISVVYASDSGFYLFALVPIVPANLRSALELMVNEARRVGADGVSHIRIEYDPASFFEFPWITYLSLTGTTYRYPKKR